MDIKAPHVFGEYQLFGLEVASHCTVTATTDCEFATLSKDDLSAAFAGDPAVAKLLRSAASHNYQKAKKKRAMAKAFWKVRPSHFSSVAAPSLAFAPQPFALRLVRSAAPPSTARPAI